MAHRKTKQKAPVNDSSEDDSSSYRSGTFKVSMLQENEQTLRVDKQESQSSLMKAINDLPREHQLLIS